VLGCAQHLLQDLNLRRFVCFLTLPAAALTQLMAPASAVVLEATCDSAERCIVNVEGDTISTSRGLQIKTDHIIGWSFVNDANRGGMFFRPRNEDYRILIKYFDENGKRKLNQIGFFNFKSAQALVSALELTSGLAPNHDQAGATTRCTAIGKDADSGTTNGSQALNPLGTLYGAGIGGVIGGAIGSAITPGVGTTLGAAIGAAAGSSLEGSSGTFSLKRNVMSEVRVTPATSNSFFDGAFAKRNECIDQPTAPTTNVFLTGPIPVKTSK
jgi:hypothetical protein